MSNGLTDGQVDLRVTGGTGLHPVTALGDEAVLTIKSGRASVPVALIFLRWC